MSFFPMFLFFLTSPFNPASLSLPSTTATFFPMGEFSAMSTEVSDVMSNSGLLSFSSKMVIETCQDKRSNVIVNCPVNAILTFEVNQMAKT